MNTEIKTCQNCKKEFTIEPEDFSFYERIQVPPPTFCPECRLERRLAWFNTFNLFKRRCDLCKKNVISVYAPDAPYVVYCPECWWGDGWDQYAEGREYDPSRPFLEQFDDLMHKVPLLGLSVDIQTSKDSPYTSNAANLKNCYLLYQANYVEDSAYGFYVEHDKSVWDCTLCLNSEWLYDSMHAWRCNRGIGLRNYAVELLNCAFMKDASNCQDCRMCASVKNKKYCIKNKQYSKEEYQKEIAKYDLGSYEGYQRALHEAEAFWATQIPKAEFGDRNVDCWGAHIYDSKNVKDSFQVNDGENCRYVSMVSDGIADSYDITYWGENLSLSYDASVVGNQSSNIRFSQEVMKGEDLEYCKTLTSSSHCFGCAGMKKAEYCILNKKYPKEEYKKLAERIKKDMDANVYRDKKGREYRYGEFFPVELSPNAYNESDANCFVPLSREKAAERGYEWRNLPKSEFQTTIPAADLPDHIRDAKDGILNEVIGCSKCGRGFKLIPAELSFLRHMDLPLPRECPFCRVNEKFKLWLGNMARHPRTCSKCGIQFVSRYPEKEASIVYCNKCYQSIVL